MIAFDADAFAKRKLTIGGADYTFRPASIRDNIDYLQGEIIPKTQAAQDENERAKILMEVIQHYVPDVPEETLWDCSLEKLYAVYYYVINGIPPETSGKN